MPYPDFSNISRVINESPGIIGKDKYFNSAVLIPLIMIDNSLHLLFEKRAPGIRQGGEVSFPGGEFNPSEDSSFSVTAIRETCEELGISESDITLLGNFGTLVAPMGMTVDVFVGRMDEKILADMKIDKSEVERVFTIPLNYFLENDPEMFNVNIEIHPEEEDLNGIKKELLPVEKFGLPSHYSKPWRRGKHRVIVYNSKPKIVWGITAEIVYEFCMKIKDKNDK